MNMMVAAGGRSELRRQSRVARALGSSFVADVLDAADRQLELGPRTAALIAGWPDDPAAAALGLRLNSAIHALARRGSPPALAALFRRQYDDFDAAIAAALQAEDRFIAEWMRSPTQTNEVARAAAISAALMVLRRETGMPAELLEIGSSCGLNLNLARYDYDLGGTRAGDPSSQVQIAPVWRGPAPEAAPLDIVSARGVDLKPLDPQDAATRERLFAYVWADQHARADRLESALALTQRFPPRVEREDALTWLEARLAEPQILGECRVIFHSMVLQYLKSDARHTFVDMLHRAGADATQTRPLAWISFEWTASRSEVQLTLTSWPSATTRLLAVSHPYADWIEWRA
ncbi:DUF2332 family protein [Sphingomonas sp. JC676]|uniref:DUF2332 domain-containing protein n=1 Tax=Sphingomonas sp. JC676 TaxID=2768065 RepID=UPI001657E589|nr:DUF2332 family protein [Sphingomonas sp. JC676]MBC9034104.1 DUF2332 family protein [Sphingomonas sp. JC676]